MTQVDVLEQLQRGEQPSLVSWFAEPVDASDAELRLTGLVQSLHSVRSGRGDLFPLCLLEIILRFWLGRDVEARYRNLFALLIANRERAVLELCLGQLLLARRQTDAWKHLDRGFGFAANLLEAEDYFTVMKRHTTLRHLPLKDTPSPVAGLQQLLDEAGVIARLKGGHEDMPDPLSSRHDTLG